MTRILALLVLVSGVARADLGDRRAVAINAVDVGGYHAGSTTAIRFDPSLDWFPFGGISIGATAGLAIAWQSIPQVTQLSWSLGPRLGWAFRLPRRWVIWPRVGVNFSEVPAFHDGVHTTEAADLLVAKGIADHVYAGVRAVTYFPNDDGNVSVNAVLGVVF